MATSENGLPVIFTARYDGPLPRLRKGVVPGANRTLVVRDGSVGFLLLWVALWFHEIIERLDLGIWDDWGWAVRSIRGQTTGYSNHASGSAIDLNATRHPRGVAIRKTFTDEQIFRIRRMLSLRLLGVIRWGGDYHTASSVDGMHFEIAPDVSFRKIERVAKIMALTPRGRRVLKANPGLKEVIYS